LDLRGEDRIKRRGRKWGAKRKGKGKDEEKKKRAGQKREISPPR